MYIYGICMALLLIMGTLLSQEVQLQEFSSDRAEIDSLSRNMLILRAAVAEYARANPEFTGAPAEELLHLPHWYTKLSGVAAYIKDGVSYIFITTNIPAGLPSALLERTQSVTIGVNRSGELVSPKGGKTAIALPAFVPEGAVVAVF